MSAWGQERHFRNLRKESGLPPTPDILRIAANRRLGKSGSEQSQQGSPAIKAGKKRDDFFVDKSAGRAAKKVRKKRRKK
jgi:hypothetical protein